MKHNSLILKVVEFDCLSEVRAVVTQLFRFCLGIDIFLRQ